VTVVAPGRNILSTLPTYTVSPTLPLTYGTLSGTSMATPLVTGLAALMWSRHPGHTNVKIKQCLQDSAVKLGAAAFDNNWGHGRVSAHAALTCGDLVIGPTLLQKCPSSITACLPVTTLCPTRIGCPTRLECPSRLGCPSRLPVLCPTTRLGCGHSSLICPSAIDACPSSLGCSSALCGPGLPGMPPVDPAVLGALIGRLADLQRRLTGAEGTAVTAGAEPVDADWFYVDDDGTVHGV
jgi:hypothetical protein